MGEPDYRAKKTKRFEVEGNGHEITNHISLTMTFKILSKVREVVLLGNIGY
jgi:hypothetical protein